MKLFSLATLIAGLLLTSAATTTTGQDDAPKPSVTVSGTCIYLGTPRDNIVVTLSKAQEPTEAQDPAPAEAPKPITSTTNDKGEYEFKNVAIGKYRLTAKGRPQNSIRAYKEADPVDVEITADTTSPVEKKIALTLDRAR
ncbi:MAG: hypothetical protein WD875_02495 [Pirellulales bacterium]